MSDLIWFLSPQLSIIPLLSVCDVYQQKVLALDVDDKEIEWEKLDSDNASLI